MRVREYRGPLGVLAAGAIGISLLCSVSAMAMSDLNNQVLITVAPLNIVDLAVSNLNTAVAHTEQAVTQFVPTPTIVSTNTIPFTPVPSDTPRRVITITPTVPRRTRQPSDNQPLPIRTNTPLSQPTRTSPPPTNTPLPPSPTDVPPSPTSIPPSPTDVPPTNPPPTDPPPTNPPPTDPPPTNPPPTDPPPTSQISAATEVAATP